MKCMFSNNALAVFSKESYMIIKTRFLLSIFRKNIADFIEILRIAFGFRDAQIVSSVRRILIYWIGIFVKGIYNTSSISYIIKWRKWKYPWYISRFPVFRPVRSSFARRLGRRGLGCFIVRIFIEIFFNTVKDIHKFIFRQTFFICGIKTIKDQWACLWQW